MESERFPSWIQEGWIRPQFSLKALFVCGDGVVSFMSYNHLPQIHVYLRFSRFLYWFTWIWVLL
jgi:hypothetical protein